MSPDVFPDRLPLVAILRALEPEAAVDVVSVLLQSGITVIEVPLNSPAPLRTISRIVGAFGAKAFVGAGTVLLEEHVRLVEGAGGRFIVAPNYNPNVVAQTLELGLLAIPGVMTVSEAFAAIDGGARILKVFPAELITPHVLRAMRVILPSDVSLMPVGGISADAIRAYSAAGANAFGVGSCLFTPAKSLDEIAEDARRLVVAATYARHTQ